MAATPKIIHVTEFVKMVPDGAVVALGGMLGSRRPVALARALADQRRRGLSLVGLTGSYATESLVAHGCVRRVRMSFVSLGLHGLAPAFTAAAADGTIEVVVESEMSIVLGIRAALQHVGFLPARVWHDTQLLELRDDVRTVVCPYTAEHLVAMPALRPDVTLLHAPWADHHGNAILGSDPGIDLQLARAARCTVVSAERVVRPDELRERGPVELLSVDVDAVVEAPQGAWPGSCPPVYEADRRWLADYVELCRSRRANTLWPRAAELSDS